MTTEQTQRRFSGERPRDELGRPLPWGAESRLALLDYDALSIEEDHRLGCEYFNAGQFFSAHEAWEGAWRKARGGPDEEFFKGLAQLGAGYTHYLRGNPHGAATLMRRAVDRLAPRGPERHGLDVAALVEAVSAHAEAMERSAAAGTAVPAIEPPRV